MKLAWFGLMVAGALVFSSLANADPAAPASTPAPGQHEGFNIFKAFRKGGRGLANILTCPFEIPHQMVKEAKRSDTVGGAAAGYLSGIPIGCGWMLYRLGVGVFDFVTGPIPTPTYEKSYIQPEFLLPMEPYTEE